MFGKMKKWREGSGWRKIWIEFKKYSCLVGRKRRKMEKMREEMHVGPTIFFYPFKIRRKTLFHSF